MTNDSTTGGLTALNGKSAVRFPDDQTNERTSDYLEYRRSYLDVGTIRAPFERQLNDTKPCISTALKLY
ncbi:hypothetical protein [Natrinema halophilum]|uniref:Uncharacterized protein n=1 Tax=Natrinema halophilum TaxID=1699371 RepID=A0A7D5GIK6_9EURY|nr:hypothetical protein [Natrinema halophilum]QLG49974.1 hypothetical protein HYG82_14480 [Natrinema halophilum]